MSWTIKAAIATGDGVFYQDINEILQNLVALAARRAGRVLGGSRVMPNAPALDIETGEFRSVHYGLGPYDVPNYVDVEIDGTVQAGFTYQARVHCRVSGPIGLTITPVIRNITDSADAGTGVACSASDPAYGGTNQKQTIALTIASGVKTYRMTYVLSMPSGESWMSGELEALATA